MNIVNGNLLRVEEGIIVHQVNCQGVMGAGIARQIKSMYPNVFASYAKACASRTSEQLLGRSQVVQVNDRLYVCNLFGQDRYGRDRRHTDYKAFEKALIELQKKSLAIRLPVFFPFGIGCGLAGGDWKIISAFIEYYIPEATFYKL